MNKAPLFSFGKSGLTLFGKSLSFSTVFAGAVIAAIVVVGGVSLSSSNPFSPDFAWSERSYESQQAYDSSSYEVQEQNESDDQLHDNEDQPDDTQDPSGDSYSQSSGTLQSFVQGSEETPSNIGEAGGRGEGFWHNGIWVDKEGFPSGGDESSDRGNPNRVNMYEDPLATGEIEHKTKDTLQSLDFSYPNGRPKVLNGQLVDLEDLFPFFELSAVKVDGGSGQASSLDIKKSDLRLGNTSESTSGALSDKEYFVQAEANGTYMLPVYYNVAGLNKDGNILCDVYSTVITYSDDPQDPLYLRFPLSSDSTDWSVKRSYYSIPTEKWKNAINEAPLNELFLGWSLFNSKEGSSVGKGFVAEEGTSYTLYNLGYETLRQGFSISSADKANGEQTLVGIDPSAVADNTVTIPAGITKVEIGTQAPNTSVKTLVIPSSVSAIDVASVLRAFPNLEGWKVEDVSTQFKSSLDQLLLIKLSNSEGNDLDDQAHEGDELISILPQRESDGNVSSTISTELPRDVSTFGEHAFDKVNQYNISLELSVGSADIKLSPEAFAALPAGTVFWVGNTSLNNNATENKLLQNQAYCSLLSKIELYAKGRSVSVALQRGTDTGLTGGSYSVDSQGVVTYVMHAAAPFKEGDRILCYVPETGASAYTIPNNIAVIGQRAFVDTTSLNTVQIPANVWGFYQAPFYGCDLDVLIIDAPESLKPMTTLTGDTKNKDALLLASGTGNNANAKLVLLEPGKTLNATEAAALKNTLVEKTYNCDKSFADSARLVTDSVSSLVVDQRTGAIYFENTPPGTGYTLFSVPTSVKSFEFLANTTAISNDAFKGCSNLVYLEIPSSVTSIGKDAFAGCAKLEVVYFDSTFVSDHDKQLAPASQGAEATNNNALYALSEDESETPSSWLVTSGLSRNDTCSSLKHVGDKNDTLREGDAFYSKDKTTLEAVLSTQKGRFDLLPQITKVDDFAFSGCTNLTELRTIPGLNKRYSIGAGAFEGCVKLNNFPDETLITSIGDRGFAASGIEGDFTLPTTIALGSEVFANNSQISQVTLKGSYATLGDSTFKGCTNLEKVLIETGATIETTGKSTFESCKKLLVVEDKGSIKTIGAGTFKSCDLLAKINFNQQARSVQAITSIEKEAFRDCPQLYLTLSEFINLTTIESYAFYNNGGIVRLVIPASVKTLGDHAFAMYASNAATSRMVEVRFAAGSQLANIGANAFQNLRKLNRLDLSRLGEKSGSSTITIGASAFAGCNALTMVEIPPQVTNINKEAFANCSELNVVAFGNLNADGSRSTSRLSAISEGAFKNCPRIQAVDLSNTQLKAVGVQAFYGNTALTSVLLPSTLLSIDNQAFADCPNIFNLVLNSSAPPFVSANAFDTPCLSKLVVNVPSTANGSALQAYRSSPSWKALFAQNSVASANNNIVTGEANELSIAGVTYTVSNGEITLVKADPALVSGGFTPLAGTTVISAGAFKGCKNLTFLYVPDSVTKIGWDAFADCTNLEGLAFNSDKSPDMAVSLFGDSSMHPRFAVYIHRSSASDFARRVAFENVNIIAAGDSFLTTDNAQVLYGDYFNSEGERTARSLIRVATDFSGALNVNDKTITINPQAALGCRNMTEVDIPSSVASVGNEAFKNCSSITTAWMGVYTTAQIDKIGDGAFEGCTSLTSFKRDQSDNLVPVLPRTLTQIGKRAFAECDSLKYLSLQGSINLPEEMVAGCDSLEYVTCGGSYIGGIKSIGARCFMNCTSITTSGASLTAFTGLETIGAEAYKGCTSLSLVTLPTSLKSIGANAFKGCTALDAIAFNPKVAPNLKGTGLEDSWNRARKFIPVDAWASYQAKISAAGLKLPDQKVACAAKSYRAISGNMYAESDDSSGTYGKLTFIATTKTALDINSNALKAYAATSLRTTEIGASALENETSLTSFSNLAYVTAIGDAAFKGCTSLSTVDLGVVNSSGTPYSTTMTIGDSAFENTPSLKTIKLRRNTTSIGARAFAQCAKDFNLDLSLMTTATTTTLGTKIFGDELPEGLKISVASASVKTSLINKWGAQLASEYGLTSEQVDALFVVPKSKTLSAASVDDSQDIVSAQAAPAGLEEAMNTVENDEVATAPSAVVSGSASVESQASSSSEAPALDHQSAVVPEGEEARAASRDENTS